MALGEDVGIVVHQLFAHFDVVDRVDPDTAVVDHRIAVRGARVIQKPRLVAVDGGVDHHLVVDRITAVHGNGSTAVRVNSERLHISAFYKRVGLLYSFYQFLAIGAMIVPTARPADMAYNAIIAIASSAFMMTLYKKRIVRGRTHMAIYSYCLLLSAYHFVRVLGAAQVGLIAATFALRVNLPKQYSSKYVLWALYCVASYALRERGGGFALW